MSSHVLIVDADSSAARVTQAGVGRVVPDATLAVVGSTREAWQSAQRHHPDVLIIDPSPDPFGCARLIGLLREQHVPVRIIVLASRSSPALRRDLERLGVTDYINKPAPLPQLLQKVQSALT
ncbi:MAG: response regulator [Anaerolineae bacterium]